MKRAITAILSAALGILIFFGAQRLVTPKYMNDILEGAFIKEYYAEPKEHDVIFVGDCEVYENFSPVALWQDYGITSYIRGSAQQLIWQSYYLLKDTLKYEKPKVVVYNVQSLMHSEPEREEYNRMTLDGMRWSFDKFHAVNVSMTEGEQFLDYLFPILRYHNRITELTKSDFTYFWKPRKVTHNGYYMRVDSLPFEEPLEEEKPENLEFGPLPMEYLDKMRELCEENEITFVLIKAPSLSPIWYDEYEKQVEAYAKQHKLLYINYLELAEELSIDYATDTYDGGLHMNLSGAEKLTKHLGAWLQQKLHLEDQRKDEKLCSIWNKKVEFYKKMQRDQEKELKKYGRLIHYGGEGSREE